MRYFIGIVPPEHDREAIMRFQKRWAGNRIMDVAEPHVTVKAQNGLTTDLAWLPAVREVCASMQPFPLTIGMPMSFGQAVVYLHVEAGRIVDLHRLLVEAVLPSAPNGVHEFEWDGYEPHLTLGQTQWGMSGQELMDMKAEAGGLPAIASFTVKHVRVYEEIERDKYRPFEDIPLGGLHLSNLDS